eukprot:9077302-Alexandrium_andersonii.AAC.1
MARVAGGGWRETLGERGAERAIEQGQRPEVPLVPPPARPRRAETPPRPADGAIVPAGGAPAPPGA